MGRAMRPKTTKDKDRRQPSTPSAKPNRPPTEYELRVYKLCKAIPKGKVTTYGAMSKVLKSSPRAVGQSLRRNPYAPGVPCHRVIAADLDLGGFQGGWGSYCESVQNKRRMLLQEGVKFEGSKVSASALLLEAELRQLLAKQPAGDLELKSVVASAVQQAPSTDATENAIA